MNADEDSSQVTAEEMGLARTWVGVILDEAAAPPGPERFAPAVPFSFRCGSRSSREWAILGAGAVEHGAWEDGKRLHVLRWRDPQSSLSCAMEFTEYADFPALEWVIRLRNAGSEDSAPVVAFNALDITWSCAQQGEMPELRRALGSDGRHDDFQVERRELRQSMWEVPCSVRMDSGSNLAFRRARDGSPPGLVADSRPSATWLPFFALRTGEDGLICALGWSGQWSAELTHDGAGKTAITAGMENLEMRLRPGEEVRSPRVLLMVWKGSSTHAANVWRQLVLRHHSPRIEGHPVEMPICNGAWGGTPTPGHLATLAAIAGHGLPYDVYWVDAGWYGTSTKPCPDVFHGDWGITGDWRVNRSYHPEGLKPISEAAHRAGMRFLLWMEPERAKNGTPVTLEHPEWFLRRSPEEPKPNDDLLLNLGHPGAWRWIVETVSALIEENGIDWYREDFNIDPAPFWAAADEEGRTGAVELRFVEGLYAFWDELRRRHPGLLIDNCASGGRRLELETIGRSVALWRTDYNCFPDVNADASQLHGMGLAHWLPLNSTSPMATPGDTYQARSAYSAGLVLNVEEFGMRSCTDPDFDWDWFRARIAEAKRLRPYFYGDFYPLTPCVFDPAGWLAYQLLLPGRQEGAVMAFRRPESPMVAASFQLRGLDPEGRYEIEDADSGEVRRAMGSELMAGGPAITAEAPRSSRLLFYRRIAQEA